MTQPVCSINLIADLDELSRMNKWLEGCAWPQGSDDAFQRIKLFLNEGVENAIRYGLDQNRSGDVRIEVSQSSGALHVMVSDNGKEFDPTLSTKKERVEDLSLLTIGGFGIELMKDAASTLRYSYVGGRNVLNATFDL